MGRHLTDEERWLRSKSEADWQSEILDAAQVGGWTWYHTHDSRRSPSGFPDLTLVRGPELVFLEVKKQTGIVTPEQAEWIEKLSQVPGIVARVARPSDASEIFELLAQQRLRR